METIKEDIFRDKLSALPLFSELENCQIEQVAAISKECRFKKNTIIFMEGEGYRGFFVVLQGSVKVYRSSSSGKEAILHIIKPFNAFADVPLFEGGNYPVSAQALEDSVLLFIPKNEFIGLLEKNISISLKMLAGFARRLKEMTNKVKDLSEKEVINRLCSYLVGEVEAGGKTNLPEPFIKLTVTKATIAAYLGTITETLSRTFRKLETEGIIRVQGKKIFISDYAKLKELGKGKS
ncbi:MAG TPA: Crp/Fnr family transcriptional regulator [Ignavibacteriales bacterium]|nr:Crp/Fnr family transcriptional regulator [Ignavibacteriales bacterium]